MEGRRKVGERARLGGVSAEERRRNEPCERARRIAGVRPICDCNATHWLTLDEIVGPCSRPSSVPNPARERGGPPCCLSSAVASRLGSSVPGSILTGVSR